MSGVPQGSVLGPLLFLLYINDIGDNFKSNYLLYADDLKIFSHLSSGVQDDLDVLSNWCHTWQLDVAPNKCEHISFRFSKRLVPSSKPTFTISSTVVPYTDKIRDLGVHFQSNLSFDNHIESPVLNCHKRINIIFNVCGTPLSIPLSGVLQYASAP
uniref:Reverse transcriptase domain-containing protein n=1 Tax=Caenorhabditis japonica TaxID=281687 RepID=A0A8R1IR14_CAEJA